MLRLSRLRTERPPIGGLSIRHLPIDGVRDVNFHSLG